MRCDHNELCKQGHLSSNGPVLDVFSMGCLFHFKQAIRRRLLKLGVSKSKKVKDFMVRGGPVDWLTVMPLDEIEEQGIAFVKATRPTLIAESSPLSLRPSGAISEMSR